MSRQDVGSHLAIRLAFFVSDSWLACRALAAPLTKSRLNSNDASLGRLLHCLGPGSVVAKQLAGALTSWPGAEPVILTGGIGVTVGLGILSFAPTV